jgi:hypothetical protein
MGEGTHGWGEKYRSGDIFSEESGNIWRFPVSKSHGTVSAELALKKEPA